MKVEHEYERGGAVAYLVALDVRTGAVIGRVEPTTGIEAFERLVRQVMAQAPYAQARRVYWISDNGSSHRGDAARERMCQWSRRAVLVNLPVHASWLNQAEIYFSIVQRKALTPNDLESTEAVKDRLLAFGSRYNGAGCVACKCYGTDGLGRGEKVTYPGSATPLAVPWPS
jgi:hypothetical protein